MSDALLDAATAALPHTAVRTGLKVETGAMLGLLLVEGERVRVSGIIKLGEGTLVKGCWSASLGWTFSKMRVSRRVFIAAKQKVK